MLIEPDDLRMTAEEFDTAKIEMDAVIKRMDDAAGNLKGKWEGVSQQAFFKEYESMRQYMDAFSTLISHVSTEMKAMAERFEDADK